MKSNSGKRASANCRACGSAAEDRDGSNFERLGKTYQVVVACASCHTSFVELSRN